MSTTPALGLFNNVRSWQANRVYGRSKFATATSAPLFRSRRTRPPSRMRWMPPGGLASPPFIEPHIHLDTTQTAGEPNWNQSGTLFEGIERWAERKALLSHEDVKARAWKTLKWQIANGIQFVRTHVDVSDPTLTALKAMLEVKAGGWRRGSTLQIVAFPQEGILSYPNGRGAAGRGATPGRRRGGGDPAFRIHPRVWRRVAAHRLRPGEEI